jgi:CxxH/CxxC protein (TIGR04129 family)
MYYACNDHIEVAIDIIVDEQEVAPVVEKIEDNSKGLSTVCSFCGNAAIYSVNTK